MPRPTPRTPLTLLLLVTALFTFLIQSGELGTSDTTHRLQVTHSLWTAQPQVFPYEYPEFGIHGRDNKLYASYGIGQSLLMLPADLIATPLSRLPLWQHYRDTAADPTVRNILISISTNVLLNVLTALAAYYFLSLLNFSTRQSILGTLALLCATTHLHYAQNMTENNFIFLLTITGFALQYKWLKSGDRRALLWGSAALGLNLLTRITTTLDILAAACFLLLATSFTPFEDRRANRSRLRTYLQTSLPIYALFFFFDRLYQFGRFDSWTTTYVTILSREQRHLDPTLPAGFPFDGHAFHGGLASGIFGPLVAPEKSIFLFDPIFPLTLLLAIVLWKRLAPEIKAYVATSLILLTAYLALYAKYDSWGGDYAWGDRYLETAVQLACLPAIPLLLRYRQALGRTVWNCGIVITAFSLIIQLASLAFWLPLEIYQATTFGPHRWVIFLRLKNIAALALGKRQAWGVNTPAVISDPWDAAHLGTWNFLPALLRHIGVAPLWAVRILDILWLVAALVLLAASSRLVRALRHQAAEPDRLIPDQPIQPAA